MKGARRSLPLGDWPAGDRRAWGQLVRDDDDVLGEPGAAARLRPATRGNMRYAYGDFLQFLAENGDLVADDTPAGRVTKARVKAWRQAAQDRGLAPTSRRALLRTLQMMMRLAAPQSDWDWITRPGGLPLRRAIPGAAKPCIIRDSGDFRRRAIALGEAALPMTDSPARRLQLRDAAALAMLAEAGPRVLSLAWMTISSHLVLRSDGTYHVRLPAEHMKNKRAHDFVLSAAASAALRSYLALSRDGFPGASASDALWMGMKGPLTVVGLKRLTNERTLEFYGQRHGPHAARHWLSHAARQASPDLARDAATILGHSEDTAAQHYAHSAALHAARRHAQRLNNIAEAGPDAEDGQH